MARSAPTRPPTSRPARIEPTGVFGAELGLPGRWRAVADLESAGAMLVGGATIDAVLPGALRIAAAGGPEEVKADTIVVAPGAVPDDGLANELGGAEMTVHVLGDCTGPGMLEQANLAAARLAPAL